MCSNSGSGVKVRLLGVTEGKGKAPLSERPGNKAFGVSLCMMVTWEDCLVVVRAVVAVVVETVEGFVVYEVVVVVRRQKAAIFPTLPSNYYKQ